MTIKRKLLLTAVFAGAVFLGGLALIYTAVVDINQIDQTKEAVIRMAGKVLLLRRDEQDFLARLELKYAEQFERDSKALQADLQQLAEALAGEGEAEATTALQQELQGYAALFAEVVELQRRVGLGPESGLQGTLRESVHQVESTLEEKQSHELMHDLLMLRRHEKDFMLRRDLAYVEKFKQTHQAVLGELKTDTQLDETTKQAVLKELERYRADFLALVQAETEKGLNYDDGKLGEMHALVNATDAAFQTLESRVTALVDRYMAWYEYMVILVVVIGIALVAGAIYIIVREILRQVGGEPAVIAAITEQVASGNLNVELGADDEDTTGIYASVKKMVHGLRTVEREREEQSWLKTGQAELNEKISGEQNISQLAENIINFLTPYVGSQVGAFYVLEGRGEDAALRMIASHAYTWRGNLSNRFKLGEGLVGQAAMEHKPIMVTELPQDHVRIESGLGQSAPSAVFIMPFLYEGELKGVLELASVHTFSAVQREFLKQIGPNIGIAVNTAESRDKMQELLAQSQAQSEELQAQTEELQAQQEELQAQQEELRQTNEEMELRSRELEQGRG